MGGSGPFLGRGLHGAAGGYARSSQVGAPVPVPSVPRRPQDLSTEGYGVHCIAVADQVQALFGFAS
jgi:hypothetical protein